MASNLTLVLTNGTGSYAMTAQEDNAVLEVLVRAHTAGFADYGRAILYRSGSDFDRAPDLANDYMNIEFNNNADGLVDPSVANLFTVGNPIVQAVRSCFVFFEDLHRLLPTGPRNGSRASRRRTAPGTAMRLARSVNRTPAMHYARLVS